MKHFLCRHRRSLVALFFLGLLIGGLWVVPDYGVPYDEFTERSIMLSHLRSYASKLFGAETLEAQFPVFEGVPRIEQHVEQDHGKAALYPIGLLMMLRPGHSERTLMFFTHGWIFLWAFLGLLAFYGTLRLLTGSVGYGLLGVLLLLASPRFIGEAFTNDKDLVFASLIALCLFCTVWFFQKGSPAAAVLLGIFGAFASNARVLGLLFLGLALLVYSVHTTWQKAWTRRKSLWLGVSIGVFCVSFYLLTPAMWRRVPEYLTYTIGQSANFQRWEGTVRYMGTLYDTRVRPLPWHYLLGMIAVTTPLLILLVVVLGLLYAIARLWRRPLNAPPEELPILVLLLLFVLLPMLFAMLGGSNLYNGWRHFYFIYVPLLCMGVLGLRALQGRIRPGLRRAIAVALAVQCMVSFGWTLRYHPYEYAYYNLLSRAPESFEGDYWNISTADALEAMVRTEGDVVLRASDGGTGMGVFNALRILPEETRERIDFIDLAEDVPHTHVIENPTYTYGVEDLSYRAYPVVTEIRVGERSLMRVYRVPAE